MRTFITTLLAALLAGSGFGGHALAQTPPGNPHGCVNPAGHVRGWCKHNNGNSYGGNRGANYITISGTVLAINGELVQFREDNGTTITVDQRSLIQAGQPLSLGGHFALHGYFSNNMFVAQPSGGYNGSAYPNGYPYPGGTASVHGIITSISGSRVTIMQGLFSTIAIDDQQALNNGTAQNLFVGRNITAYGYWNNGTFYATSIG